MTWWTVLFVFLTNVMTAAIILGLEHRWHHHSWSVWSPWVVDTDWKRVMVRRYRNCDGCGKVLEQRTGMHDCDDANRSRQCTHVASLIEDETTRLTRMERELGLTDRSDP
jgi:hypothetical protein